MGIQGLLPFLKKIHTPVNIAQFKGCTVAIDAYCWLHKGAFSCAEKLALKEDTDQYVYYCMKYINYILNSGLKPIMVFDGGHLESKAGVEKTRRERRELHRKKAAQFLREGKRSEAKECLQRCVDITPQMALKLIQACRDRGVDCIVAPYEADAQLAYLNQTGIAQIIVTEDSDLLLFGCEKIIFKMDLFGNGTLIEKARLNEVMAVQSGFYTFDKFRHMCILSGCDYLSSLHGIGLAKANKVFKLARQGDIKLLLKKLPTYLKMNLVVEDDYVEGFLKAENTFLHQLIFDPLTRTLKPLNPYPPELQGADLKYAGHHISTHMAYQIALGNIDIHNREPMADFDPDTFVAKHPGKPKYRHELSIWDKNYAIRTGSPCKEIQPSAVQPLLPLAAFEPTNHRVLPKNKSTDRKTPITTGQDKQHCSPLKASDVSGVYKTKEPSLKTGKKRCFDFSSGSDSDEELPAKQTDVASNLSIANDDQIFSDENETPPPEKRPKKDSPKFKYNAANIGEETFKEESATKLKDKSLTRESCAKSRNIFAVSKAVKSNLKTNSPTCVKSKYFNNAPPKPSTISGQVDDVEAVENTESSSSSNEVLIADGKNLSQGAPDSLKPVSLKDMFKKLKEKRNSQEEKPHGGRPVSLNETSTNKKSQHRSTPSAFCWSKFKSNSHSNSQKTTKTNADQTSRLHNTSSEKLENESESLRTNFSSVSKDSYRSCLSLKRQNLLSSLANKSEESPTLLLEKQTECMEVQECKSESYQSFLKSMSFGGGDTDKYSTDFSEDPEMGKTFKSSVDGESPFPEDGQGDRVISETDIDSDAIHDLSSQEIVVDLTVDSSETYTSSSVSRTSNASGRSNCRVSGLSRKKERSNKKGAKPDSNQKSIKDLFSKFAFKGNKSSQGTSSSLASHPVVDSLEENDDDDQQATPTSKSLDTDSVALVRRRLKL